MTESAPVEPTGGEGGAPASEPIPEIKEGPSAIESLDVEGEPQPDGVDSPVEDGGASEDPGELSAEELATLQSLLPRYRHKLKVGGEESELAWDDLIKNAQKAGGADKRFQEAAEKAREAELVQQNWQRFLQALENDPVAVLKNPEALGIPGWKAREAAEAYLTEELKRELMPEGERRALELEEENRRLREAHEARERENVAAQRRQLENHYAQEFDQKITGALEASQLPKTPQTVKRVAEIMYSALEKGIDADPAEVVELVAEEYQQEYASTLGSMSPEKLVSMLPKEVADAIRKADLAKIKSPIPESGGQRLEGAMVENVAESAKSKPKKSMTMDEWRDRNRKLMEKFG